MRKGWNLEADTWHALNPLLNGLEWRRVPFHDNHKSNVINSSGVYMICAKTPVIDIEPFASFYNVLYIGLSKTSVRGRFQNHCNDPDTNIKKAKQLYNFVGSKMSFHFAAAPETCVEGIERQLIECFGPSSNRQSGINAKIGDPIAAG